MGNYLQMKQVRTKSAAHTKDCKFIEVDDLKNLTQGNPLVLKDVAVQAPQTPTTVRTAQPTQPTAAFGFILEELNKIWTAIDEEKRTKLDEVVLPAAERIFGTFQKPSNIAIQDQERDYVTDNKGQTFKIHRELQVELAALEQRTLYQAIKLNDLVTQILNSPSAHDKVLGQSLDEVFNSLRRQVIMNLSLIQDVYGDDPECPNC
ncbi:hypothetical protein HYR54_08380 [Candidatus Acetothermia bacterium]|nr:hypothetical protein [Candidatus Acetothermia bacterium]